MQSKRASTVRRILILSGHLATPSAGTVAWLHGCSIVEKIVFRTPDLATLTDTTKRIGFVEAPCRVRVQISDIPARTQRYRVDIANMTNLHILIKCGVKDGTKRSRLFSSMPQIARSGRFAALLENGCKISSSDVVGAKQSHRNLPMFRTQYLLIHGARRNNSHSEQTSLPHPQNLRPGIPIDRSGPSILLWHTSSSTSCVQYLYERTSHAESLKCLILRVQHTQTILSH